MFRKYMMFAVLYSSIILNAMQGPMEIEQNQKNWLLYLPTEICNLIASYLPFDDVETEEEFIERTKKPQNIPQDWHKLISTDSDYFPTYKEGYGSRGTLVTVCPNDIKLAVLELRYGNNHTPKLIIADIKKKELITYNIAQKNYDKIAISRNADLFATLTLAKINPEADFDRSLCGAFIHELKIQKTNSLNEQQIIQVGFDFEIDHHTIAFNKQGTHIIIHGVDYTKTNDLPSSDIKKDPMPHHLIFPIYCDKSDATPPEKTLQHYFQQRYVCKDITKSLDISKIKLNTN